MRLWDVRSLGAPLETAQQPLGGGVWRLAWHPREADTLLAACMQAGFALLRGGRVAMRHGEQAKEGEHGSLAYGVGWCRTGDGVMLAVSASFYDRSVQAWRADS